MKLFVYYDTSHDPMDIHAVRYLKEDSLTLCSQDKGVGLTYQDFFDKKDYLDTSRPFCKTCNRILNKKGIDMKQLAINQKLGVK